MRTIEANETSEDMRRILTDTIAELGRVKAERDELAAIVNDCLAFWGQPYWISWTTHISGSGGNITRGQWIGMITDRAHAALAKLNKEGE